MMANVSIMTESKRLKTRDEAAEYAGVSVVTIDRWVRAGHLTRFKPPVRGGRGPYVFLDLDEIDELIRPVAS